MNKKTKIIDLSEMMKLAIDKSIIFHNVKFMKNDKIKVTYSKKDDVYDL